MRDLYPVVESPRCCIVDDFSQVRTWPAAQIHPVFLTPGWTAGVEGALGSAHRYATCWSQAGTMIGSVSAYHVHRETRPFLNPHALLTHQLAGHALTAHLTPIESARGAVLTDLLTDPLADSTISVAPFGFTHSISSTNAAGRLAALDSLDVIAQEWGTTCTGVLYVGENDPVRGVLLNRNMVEVLVGADCVLQVDFGSLDEYFTTLSRSQRKAARHERRAFLASGITLALEDPVQSLDQMAHLQARLQEKYGMGYHPDAERAAISSVLAAIPQYVRVMVARRDGTLVGFVIFYEKDGSLHPKMGARDTSAVADSEFVYFNMGYYSMIEYAVTHGIKEIRYGPEAYGAKLRRGCALEPHYWYLKVDTPWAGALREVSDLVSGARRRLLESTKEQA